jgi:hypothetical protein
MATVSPRAFSDAELDAAVQALADRDRMRDAQDLVVRVAPQLQRVLNEALATGGWFETAHEGQIAAAARTQDEEERLAAVRTLVAEETRLGMFVGVAVGFELARELNQIQRED